MSNLSSLREEFGDNGASRQDSDSYDSQEIDQVDDLDSVRTLNVCSPKAQITFASKARERKKQVTIKR